MDSDEDGLVVEFLFFVCEFSFSFFFKPKKDISSPRTSTRSQGIRGSRRLSNEQDSSFGGASQEKRIGSLQKLKAFQLEHPESGFELCSVKRMNEGAKPGPKFDLRTAFQWLVEVVDAHSAREQEVRWHAANAISDWGLAPCLQRR